MTRPPEDHPNIEDVTARFEQASKVKAPRANGHDHEAEITLDGDEGADVALARGVVRWPHLSEDYLALVFADRHARELRYAAIRGRWLAWVGTHWEVERTLDVFDKARKICREAAGRSRKDAVALGLAKAKTVAAVEMLSRSDRRIAATVEQFDADLSALNAPGALINLKEMTMRQNDPLDYCTKKTGAAPAERGAKYPLWLSFLSTAMGGDQALVDYLQRVCGYCLTGSIKEHALFFLYGTGGNGKGVFINTLRGIIGDYHTSAPIETFTELRVNVHPTELAGLRGARLVTAVETEEGRRWAESKIKALTGGDEISARFMRQDFFSFTRLSS